MGFLEVLRVFLSVFLIFFFFNWTIKRVQFRKLDDRFDSLFNERVNGLYFFFFSLCNYGRFDRIFD